MKKRYLLFIMMLSSIQLSGQQNDSDGHTVIEQIVEMHAETLDETADMSMLIETLESYLQNPLNINTATQNELEQLPFLTAFQVQNLLEYRNQVGQLYSVYEIMAVDGFNAQLASLMEPFLRFDPIDTTTKQHIRNELNLRYNQVLEQRMGYLPDSTGEKTFEGSAQQLLLKYRGQAGDRFMWGLSAENDAGEAFFTKSNKQGFDFYSAYFSYHGNKQLRTFTLGDYQIKAGQGLVMWSSYASRKSTDLTNSSATGQGIKNYTSTDENAALRGLACEWQLGPLGLIGFYSQRKLDASPGDTSENGSVLNFTSLVTTGYHRTNSEINSRDRIRSQLAGGVLTYRHNRFEVSINSITQWFDHRLQTSDRLYNLHYFSGDFNYNISSSLRWIMQRNHVYGELALSRSGGKALLLGSTSQPVDEVLINIVYRDYAANYHSIKGTSFGEWDDTRNEQGIYSSLSLQVLPGLSLSAYIDVYRSYWMRYNSLAPVRGRELAFQAKYQIQPGLACTVRMSSKSNNENAALPGAIKTDTTKNSSKGRINLEWEVNEMLKLRFRAEGSVYKKDTKQTFGAMIYTDASVQALSQLRFTTRFAYFNTQDYNSRIYTYEHDVPQSFYIPAFYSRGLRYYLNLGYAPLPRMKIYLKIAQAYYLDESFTIGSGPAEIEGRHRTDLKIQLTYRL